MTRINVVPVEELTQKHLIAEYREIMRLPGNLKKSLTKPDFSVSEIPNNYVLGKGHVKFFYNKMKYLRIRFEALVQEMINRGYNPNFRDSSMFEASDYFYQDYIPTIEALELNRKRIKERS